MTNDLPAFQRKLDHLAGEFSDRAMRRIAEPVGRAGAKDVEKAVRGDLGDTSMSGWRRGSPIPVTGRYLVNGSSVVVLPQRRAAGPMRVLQSGRNQGNAGGFAGPGVNRSTGLTARTRSGAVRKVRARAPRRWNGRTAAKGTWSDAVAIIERETPKRVAAEVPKAIRRALGGG